MREKWLERKACKIKKLSYLALEGDMATRAKAGVHSCTKQRKVGAAKARVQFHCK